MQQNHKFRVLVVGLCAGVLAACAVPAQAPNPPGAKPEAAGPTLPPTDTEPPPLPAADARTMTCATLNSASDDDKAYASSFLLGYRAALMRSHTIDVKQIETVEIAALADCASVPDALASRVFGEALQRVAAGTDLREIRPLRRTRRVGPSYEAAPGGMVPSDAPNETPVQQTAPTQPPPMRFAPAETPPPQASPVPLAPATPSPQASPVPLTPATPAPSAPTPLTPPPVSPPPAVAPSSPPVAPPPAASPQPASPQPVSPPATPTPPPPAASQQPAPPPAMSSPASPPAPQPSSQPGSSNNPQQ
jgi:hypothetical protein